ncbi:MAG: 3-phosphoshikimate 1-carboxyvinyltransferase [Bacillota bacterium]
MQMKISGDRLTGTVHIPSSKSHVHRLLMAAAFATTPCDIAISSWSEDIEVTKNCLNALGSQITYDEKNSLLHVIPMDIDHITPINKVETDIFCRESGSTLRFLLPVIGALGVTCRVDGAGRLPERPIGILLDEMKAHGVEFSADTLPLTLQNQMSGGRFSLAGNVSSQFITGLLFALSLLKVDSEIVLTSPLESKTYVDMTIEVMELFGISVEVTETGYKIKGGQLYTAPQKIVAEGDWSSACFWVVGGCCVKNSNILLTGISENSVQGDKKIIELMRKMGGNITKEGDGLRCQYTDSMQGIDIDVSQIPDAVPILATAGALAKGTMHMHEAARVRIKESDRLLAMKEGLAALAVTVSDTEDTLTVTGSTVASEATNVVELDGFADHRIVMSLAIATVGLGRESMISTAEAIGKSYPRFFEDFRALGGVADVIDVR